MPLHKNRLVETVLTRGHNIFLLRSKKTNLELSSKPHFIRQSAARKLCNVHTKSLQHNVCYFGNLLVSAESVTVVSIFHVVWKRKRFD